MIYWLQNSKLHGALEQSHESLPKALYRLTGALFTKQRLHQQLFKMASRQGPSIKAEGPWRRASFYRVSLSHCRRIKELASSVFGG
jgi:hypothetical protein